MRKRSNGRELPALVAWYGSEEAARAVMDGALGDVKRTLRIIDCVATKRRQLRARMERATCAPLADHFVHARTLAPRKCDLVAQALAARPDFQKAWSA